MSKTNDCEATLRKGDLPPAEAVKKETPEVKYCALHCAKAQAGVQYRNLATNPHECPDCK